MEGADCVLPTLSINRGLLVPRGTTVVLGPDLLALSDPDTPPKALTFALSQPPQYGQLLLAASALTSGSNFTQKNIQEAEVAYRHDGGPSKIDRFGFTASDGSARGFLLEGCLQTATIFFTVQVSGVGLFLPLPPEQKVSTLPFAPTLQIQPLDRRAPDVLKVLPLWKAEPLGDGRYGIFLSSHQVKARGGGGGGQDEQLIFSITRQPYFGYLENITTGG